MKKLILASMIVFAIVGCAAVKQARNDVQTGYTTPLAQGEASPQEQARPIAQNVTGVITTIVPVAAPFAIPIQAGLAGVLGLFFAWQRGRSIRKSQPISSNPVTGFLGNSVGLEGLVQGVSTVSQGITELFHEGSSAQHAWQGILTGLAGVAGTAVAVPQVGAIVSAHPEIYAWVAGIAGAANAIQQSLTKVLPVNTQNV